MIDAKEYCTDPRLHGIVEIPSPSGMLVLRPERPEDHDFRFRLFCDSRLPEWYVIELDAAVRDQLMRHQFVAQTTTYRQRFPRARFDIIELGGEPIGRIVVNRPGTMVHIVDHAIVPALRNRGIGTAIMRALMQEAQDAGLPVRLKVASSNDPSMKLYLRLGLVPIETIPAYIEMQWPAPTGAA